MSIALFVEPELGTVHLKYYSIYFHTNPELHIRGDTEDNSKIIFLISQ